MSLIDQILTPYAISFTTNSSCERQSKTFERSASNAPKISSAFLLNLLNNADHYSIF